LHLNEGDLRLEVPTVQLAIEYSFRLRHQDTTYEAIVPADRLLGAPLDIETVRRLVEHDDVLLAELFRDFFAGIPADDEGPRVLVRGTDA